jgi:outer membrane cobalamin receptor
MTTDNGQTVDSYNVGDVSLTQYFQIKKLQLELNFRINNIWDKSYVILPARPMPMRNYLVSLKARF